MFSLSKIKNKKSFFLPIILFFAFSSQCYGMEDFLKGGLGDKDNPIHIVTFQQKTDSSSEENSGYYRLGWTLLPIVAGATVNYAYNKWNEDPEMTALTKKEKQMELDLKNHPDYSNVYILQQRNIAQEKINNTREKQLELNVKEAQLVQHHQDELTKFLRCDKTMFTQNFCDYMTNIHQHMLEQITQQKNSQ